MKNKKRIPIILLGILILPILLPMGYAMLENEKLLAAETADNTEYYINTVQDLWGFAEEVNNGNTFSETTVYLTADINLDCNEEKVWTPMNKFNGTFKGQGYTISGIYINVVSSEAGLFATNNGEIENLKISDSYITATNEVDADIAFIAGYNSSGIIRNCRVINSEINIESTEGSYVGGISGYNYGIIEYCENDASIYTEKIEATGGIVGENYGIVKKSKNTGEISGGGFTNYNSCGIGGVVGSSHSKVILCANHGNITSNATTGGVVGTNFSGNTEIMASYNLGTLKGSSCGGIVGRNGSSSNIYTSGGKVTNCYNAGQIISSSKSGGICYSNKDGGEVKNCYYLEGDSEGIVVNSVDNTETIEKSEADMQTEVFVELLNSDGKQYEYTANEYPNIDLESPNIEVEYGEIENNSITVRLKADEFVRELQGWARTEDGKTLIKTFYINQDLDIVVEDYNYNQIGVTIGINTISDTVITGESYYINNFEDLQKLVQEVNNGNNFEGKRVYLMSNIDIDENYTWDVIGQSTENSFNGNFYGNSKRISGISVNEYAYYKGFFGYTKNASIIGLEVIGEINGESKYTGGIVACAANSYMENCINNIKINETYNDYDNNLNNTWGAKVGGIAGYATKNSKEIAINECINNGEITYLGNGGASGTVAGIVGTMQNAIISFSSNNANIISRGAYYIGGIAGETNGEIKGCNNNGNIVSNSIPQGLGGIVGKINSGKSINNYNIGDIDFEGTGTTNGTGSIYCIGGIVGRTYNSIELQNCYNVGNVETGGIVGKIESSNGTVKNNYYLNESAEYGYYTSKLEELEIIEKTDEEMKNEDFVQLLNNNTTLWKYDTSNINNGYPYIARLSSLSITTPPNKTTYIEGQDFDTTGMIVTAIYSDENTSEVTDYTVVDGDNLSVDKTEIKISYTDEGVTKTTTQEIVVEEKRITSIAITTRPTKLNYIEGQNFDKSGMVVTATYNDESTSKVTNYTILDGENLSTDKTSVTISYTEEGVTQTATQEITVTERKLTEIEITREPTKLEYLEGENFDATGMIVTAIYNDESRREITNYTVVNGENLSTDQTEVTIRYTEEGITKAAVQKIKVLEELRITIKEYQVKQENEIKYLCDIISITTVAEALENIETNGNIEIYKDTEKVTDTNEKVTTDMKIKISLNNQSVEYTTVVTGDLNGDGEIGDIDLLRMARYKAELDKDLNGAYLKAADIYQDNNLADDIDLLKLVRVLVGLDTL